MSEDVYVTARVPAKLREILELHVARDTHMNESEYMRDALREKLQREAHDLFDSIVRKNSETTHPSDAPRQQQSHRSKRRLRE